MATCYGRCLGRRQWGSVPYNPGVPSGSIAITLTALSSSMCNDSYRVLCYEGNWAQYLTVLWRLRGYLLCKLFGKAAMGLSTLQSRSAFWVDLYNANCAQ